MRPLFATAAVIFCAGTLLAQTPPKTAAPAPVNTLIPWLLREDAQLRRVAFAEVIHDTTGHRVLPLDPKSATDRAVIQQISIVLDRVVRQFNAKEGRIHGIARINEVSSHFEDALRKLLDAAPGLDCDFPHTANGHGQRSGYPDLRVVEERTKRVYYLDPKLYAAGSRASSFRTFYFEPRKSTNKVLDDAVHLVAGFEHAPRQNGRWKFTRWDLVDLADFQVKLKAEFQGSNRDLYRPEAIVATSGGVLE